MRHPPRLVVLGRQGSGKGTQSERLAARFAIRHVATGDLLREAVRAGTAIGRRVAPLLEHGALVPDDLVVDLVRDEARRRDWGHTGFVLDGFPRTVAQAAAFFGEPTGEDHTGSDRATVGLDAAVLLDVSVDVVLDRLARRRVCPVCDTTVTVEDPQVVSVPCPRSHGPAVRRDDDRPEAIRRRLELYEAETGPLLPWFDRRGELVRVDGTGTPDEVFQRVLTALDAVLDPTD